LPRRRGRLEVRMRYLLVGAILLLPLQGCGNRGAAGEVPAVQSALSLLRSDAITKLEILYVPVEICTFMSLTPDGVEKSCRYRIIVEQFRGSKFRDDLISALEKSDMRPSTDEGDLRWACIFYDAGDERVLTMYFDGFGQFGMIAGTSVTTKRRFGFGKLRLVMLLERRCASLWE
jgi:hypothetical protein